ncbi:TetR/AcrR family transcriptional regulator [Motilibacter sp. K478]|nr:TetR/AcrR family transcriptional regulator [Motilibacter aurantiacus]NHC45098.1 TetR/AcrR family transcriptional regulator [Motilibacter aurantiacus]
MDPGERQERILDAATAAFAATPYDDVALAPVAAAAGASEALVYRYFAGKAGLYAAVVQRSVDDLVAAHEEALAQLAPAVPARDRVRAATLAYLEHVARHPSGWLAPLARSEGEPEPAATIRRDARADYVARLRGLLQPGVGTRREYALWGFFGFLNAAALRWLAEGCPEDARWPLVDAALGALEGGLGDWAA